MRIDAHQHFWKYNASDYAWINNEMALLKKDFMPEDLEPLLKNSNYDGSIVVQARQSLVETNWLLLLASKFNFIKGVIGWVDLVSPGLISQLELLSSNNKFVGVRHVLQDEPDDNYMLRIDFLSGMKLLEKFDLGYDILVFPKHLSNAERLVGKFPNQRFILDHIAKPSIKKGMDPSWKQGIYSLAKHSNVSCKLSGLVSEADWSGWTVKDLQPFLEVVLDTFGPKRLMIGSDWPVCTLAAKYQEIMNVVH